MVQIRNNCLWSRGLGTALLFCTGCSLVLGDPFDGYKRRMDDAGGGKTAMGMSADAMTPSVPDVGDRLPEAGDSGQSAADAGDADAGTEAVPPASCSTNNGGCDPLVSCSEEQGAIRCGKCPPGYQANASKRCVRPLTNLTVSEGTLEPQFSPNVTGYTLRLSLFAERVTLAVSAAGDSATIAVNSQTVRSGGLWQAPLFDWSGRNTYTITVSEGDLPDNKYVLHAVRAAQDADYLGPNTGSIEPYFGEAVDMEGDTMVVGSPKASPPSVGIYVRADGRWRQQAKLEMEQAVSFGELVAISGDTIVVAAPYDSTSTRGVQSTLPDLSDSSRSNSGAAFVFIREGESWKLQAYLKASNSLAYAGFGLAVAIDGDTIVVGAPRESGAGVGVNNKSPGPTDASAAASGAAYVFQRVGTTWTEQAYIKASNTDAGDEFATSVAIDGNRIVVGAPRESSVARGINNSAPGQADNSLEWSGAAYVFQCGQAACDGQWVQEAYLKAKFPDAEDFFGQVVKIQSSHVVVLNANDDAAASVGANPADNSVQDLGAVYWFKKVDEAWSQAGFLTPFGPEAASCPHFGSTMDIDYPYLLVGGCDDGYVFRDLEFGPYPHATLRIADGGNTVNFETVALSGDTVVVAGQLPGAGTGAVWTFH